MCSPHYTHVMANSSKGNLGGMDPAVARGPGGGFPTALASAAPESGMWEIMVRGKTAQSACWWRNTLQQ